MVVGDGIAGNDDGGCARYRGEDGRSGFNE